jgi:predicted ATP-binding protein involved in virulence
LLQLDYGALKESEVQQEQARRLTQVKELLKKLLPGVREVGIGAPSRENRSASVRFKTADGWVPLDAVGYGYRNTVAWVVDLASRLVERYPDSVDPLGEPAVVFVDEIDLHLHPTWQRTLMTYLTECFPRVQFVVTAHSPLFVQAAAGANLVLLKREKKRVTIVNDVDEIANWRLDQIVTSELFGLPTARPPQLDAALKERKSLLSKGTLTGNDKTRLAELERTIGPLPSGETAEDVKTRKLLRETLRVLQATRETRGNGQ